MVSVRFMNLCKEEVISTFLGLIGRYFGLFQGDYVV